MKGRREMSDWKCPNCGKACYPGEGYPEYFHLKKSACCDVRIVRVSNTERLQAELDESKKQRDDALARVYELKELLSKLLSFADAQICRHEDTYRGGYLWEICRECGAQWSDDQGGMPEFEEPAILVEVKKVLCSDSTSGVNRFRIEGLKEAISITEIESERHAFHGRMKAEIACSELARNIHSRIAKLEKGGNK
jgi:hypothetical protein